MSGKVLFVSDDVMFWARVQAAAKAAGREVARIPDEAAMEGAFLAGGVARVIVDLRARGIDAAGWAARWKSVSPAPQLVAYGSHVDEAGLSEARRAGFDVVMANAQFHRTLQDWL